MTEPVEPPRLPVPRQPVNAASVFAGMGIGVALSWGLRAPLWYAFAGNKAGTGFYVAVFLPTAALIAATLWSFLTRRTGWGLGMSIYLGVGALVFGPVFALYAMCAPSK